MPHVLVQPAFTAGCFVHRPLALAMVHVMPFKLKPALSPHGGACRAAGKHKRWVSTTRADSTLRALHAATLGTHAWRTLEQGSGNCESAAHEGAGGRQAGAEVGDPAVVGDPAAVGAAAGALPLAVPPLHVPHVLAQLAFTAGCFVQRPLVFALVQSNMPNAL